ncbi:MAG: AlbA family DNA-binding domain-containing protein [Glycocaulis sp.]
MNHISDFSPFNASIGDLEVENLSVLREVEEGWYVDYKEASISAKRIAKSLASFANTYGGWLFFGVREKSRSEPVAGEFPGLRSEEAHKLVECLRHGAAAWLSHSPYFETQILRGPCEELGLLEDKSVVVIFIPQSWSAPHIHKDGGIYRRVESSSEPTKESDRYAIEQLFKRRETPNKIIKKWIKRKPEFSDSEVERPVIRVLLDVDPFFNKNLNLSISEKEAVEILKNRNAPSVVESIPFDTVQLHASGLLGSQTRANNFESTGVSLKVNSDLSGEILIPINRMDHADFHAQRIYMEEYEHFSEFSKNFRCDDGYYRNKIADLNYTMIAISGILYVYMNILSKCGWKDELYVKVQAFNIWRAIPFLDVQYYMDWIEEHGCPMPPHNNELFPSGYAPESFVKINCDELSYDDSMDMSREQQEAVMYNTKYTIEIFKLVCRVFGVPDFVQARDFMHSDNNVENYKQLRDLRSRVFRIIELNRRSGAL